MNVVEECMYVYICILRTRLCVHKCKHPYVCINVYICVPVNISMYIQERMNEWTHVYICMCVYTRGDTQVYANICRYVCTHIYIYMCAHVYTSKYWCIYIHACWCKYLYVCKRKFVYVYVYMIPKKTHVFVCGYAHPCVRANISVYVCPSTCENVHVVITLKNNWVITLKRAWVSVRTCTYGVALVSRIDKIIGLFCKRSL